MLSRKGRIYSFGSLTLVGLISSLVGVATQSPETGLVTAAAGTLASQTGLLSILQEKGFDLVIELLKGLGSIGLELGADDARHILLKVAKSLNENDGERNHDIAKAIRQAILSIIQSESTEINDFYDRAAIKKILLTTAESWAWIELLERDNLITISEEKIPHFFAVKAETIAKIESPVTESQWKLFLLEIARQNNTTLSQESLNRISLALYNKFPQALREVFAQDFANDGVAYGKLSLALVGDISASQNEILNIISDISQKQDKFHSTEMEWLRKIYKAVEQTILPSTLPKYIAADYFPAHTNYFTGRNEVIEQILKTLKNYKRASLHGISGLGKTSVILEFVKRYEDSYKNIFFLRATRGDALSGFGKLAEKVDPSIKSIDNDAEKAATFKTWLEENNGWLLLIDNVDVPHEVLPLLPINLRGHILATGNSPEITVLGNEVEIKTMSSQNSEELLYRRAKTLSVLTDEEIKARLNKESEAERDAIKNIVGEFDGLPLAMNLAGAFIHKYADSFANYLQIYRKGSINLLNQQDLNDSYQRNSVARAFSLAFNKISTPEDASLHAKLIADAAVIYLKTATFLASDSMPNELFVEVLASQSKEISELLLNPMFLRDVYIKIAEFDLFEKDIETQTFDIHRLVQKVIANKIESGEKHLLCTQVLDVLDELLPYYDYTNRELCERYFRHTIAALENANNISLENEKPISLYTRIADYQRRLGYFLEAETFYQQALILGEEFYDEDEEIISDLSFDLAHNYYLQEKFREALLFCEKSVNNKTAVNPRHLNLLALIYNLHARNEEAIKLLLTARKKVINSVGRKGSLYATILFNLATFYNQQGRHEEAVIVFEECFALEENTLDKENDQYAKSLSLLAGILSSRGNLNEAIEKYKQAITIWEKIGLRERPDTADALKELADIYCRQYRWIPAVEKYIESISIYAETASTEHPAYKEIFDQLANIYTSHYNQKALAAWEEKAGKEYVVYAASLKWLGNAYRKQQRYEEAVKKYDEALGYWEHLVGYEHPEYIKILDYLIDIYRDQQKRAPFTIETHEAALEYWEIRVGTEHIIYATGLKYLGMAYCKQQRYEEAVEKYDQAIYIWENFADITHPAYMEVFNLLINIYSESLGNQEWTIKTHEKAIEYWETRVGKQHSIYATGLTFLGNRYFKLNKYEEAVEKYVEALYIWEKLAGRYYQTYLEIIEILGKIYLEQQKNAPFNTKTHEEALARWEKRIGKDHPVYAEGLRCLGTAYCNQHRYEEAVEKYEEALAIWEKFVDNEYPAYTNILNRLTELYAKPYENRQWTVKTHEELLSFWGERVGTEHIIYAAGLKQLAKIYFSARRYKEAVEKFEKIVCIWEEFLGSDHPIAIQERENLQTCRQLVK